MQYRISHAQNFEDVMLWRALSGVAQGRYIDIGAQSPDIDSVSRLFFEAGWRGVHVDACADYAEQLRAARPNDTVVEAAITDHDGTLRFHEITGTGLSTSSDAIAKRHAEAGFAVHDTEVKAMTLDSLFERVGSREIHWLKIDVEGSEASVLRGWRTSPVRPWIVVVESTRPLSQIQSHEEWEPLLTDKGYRFVWFDGLNRFYVSSDHPELATAFTVPPNIFDDFALSGEANAPFARVVARQRDEAQAQAERARRDASLERAEAAHQREGREMDRQAASAALARVHAEAEASLSAARADAEAALAAANVHAEAALAAEREGAQARFDALRNASMMREQQMSSQLAAEREELRRTQDLLHSTRSRLEEARVEAHRWWSAAEALRAERDSLLRSLSWRLTAPLRAARRLLSDPRNASRMYARRGLSFAMRRVVASSHRSKVQSLLGRIPGARDRMRAIAIADGVIPGESKAVVFQPAPTSRHPGLSAEARRVHARLRDAMSVRN
ncbi:FkbM family methyltransferase [Lysobacter sp. HA18]